MYLLFTKSEQRLLRLVSLLLDNRGYSIKELSSILNYSERTIKDDLLVIEQNYSPLITFVGDHNKLRIKRSPSFSFRRFLRDVMNNSLPFQISEYIFFQKNKGVEAMADDLSVSTTTAYRNIKQVNEQLESFYDFEIRTSPLSLVGDEYDIRGFFLNFFYEKYAPFEWPFETIDRQVLREFLQLIIKSINVSVNFERTLYLEYVVAISIYRYNMGHTSDVSSNKEGIYQLASYLFSHPVFMASKDTFEEGLGLDLSESALIQIFSSFLEENMTLTSQIFGRHSDKKVLYEPLQKMIEELKETYQLTLTGQEEEKLIFWVHNIIQFRNGNIGYNTLINDHLSHALNFLKNFHPDFWFDLRRLLENYMAESLDQATERDLDFATYTLYISWPNLLQQLSKQQQRLKILVISYFDSGRAQVVRDIVSSFYMANVEIHAYEDSFLDLDKLQDQGWDIIFSDFILPDIPGTEQIVFDEFPKFYDIIVLKQTVDRLRKGDYSNFNLFD